MFGENYVNVPFDQSQGTNMFLRVINIKIMLNTNILGMTPTPLTFDMLHHHDLEKGRYPTAQYSLPYFTDSVKYPMDYLTSKTYSERVDFFFNKKRFNTMCRTFGTNYIDYAEGDDDGDGDDEQEERDEQEQRDEQEEREEDAGDVNDDAEEVVYKTEQLPVIKLSKAFTPYDYSTININRFKELVTFKENVDSIQKKNDTFMILNLFENNNNRNTVFDNLTPIIPNIIKRYNIDIIKNTPHNTPHENVLKWYSEIFRVYNAFVFITIKTNLINWVIYAINTKPKTLPYNSITYNWKKFIYLISEPFLPTVTETPDELKVVQKNMISQFNTQITKQISKDKEVINNKFYTILLSKLKEIVTRTENNLTGIENDRKSKRPKYKTNRFTYNGGKKDPEKLSNKEMENADHNVRCMLILLLPIADEFTNVFQSSYDQYILNKPSPELYTLRNIDPTMLLNPTWLPFYNYFAARKYAPPIQEISYIKQGGAKYAVASVIWLNDIVNHPIYREFLTTYYEKNLEKQNNRPKIKTQLTERLQMFRGLIQRNQSTKTPETTLFMQMFETLLQNVNITTKTQGKKKITPSEQISKIVSQFSNDANPDTAALTSDINKTVSAVTNPKDAAKRDSVIKMATSFAKIIATNNKLKQNGKLSNADWFSMADNIVSAYIEYSLYNESADKGMQINLKDDARNFTELYNQSLFIKAIQLIDDFLHNRISRFDMNEKNLDGTPKSKLELDIIRIIQKSFPYYIKLNDDIVKHLRNVLEPRRRSSNAKLQSFLKNMFIPDNTSASSGSTSSVDQYALVEIYNKYIANTRKHIHKRFTDELMYTGVNTIVESDGSPTNTTSTTQKPVETPSVGNKPSGGDDSKPAYREIPEIYVYVNVVQKDEYEGSDNRACIMSDDVVANNLKRVLFTNTMLDDSFPEVNPYRVFQFLKGSENKTPFNAENMTKPLVEGNVETNKSNSQSPTPNVVKGGSKRPSRNTYKYVPKRFVRRNTRKHR